MRLWVVFALLLLFGGFARVGQAAEEGGGGDKEVVTVFLAASLQPLFLALAPSSPVGMRLVPASSGLLARQISLGAPADLYITADPHWADWLSRDLYSARRALLSNRLALIAPEGSGFNRRFLGTLSPYALQRQLSPSQVQRLALGDPMHVPAGRYAAQSLEALGISLTEPRGFIVPLGNVRAVVLHIQRKEADFGIVYRSDALQASRVRVLGLFPQSLHDSIRYDVLLLQPRARRLYTFLGSDAAFHLYRRFGFVPL